MGDHRKNNENLVCERTLQYFDQSMAPSRAAFLTGCLVGVLVFILIFGIRVLNPTYVDWIYGGTPGDLRIAQFGWEFFRNDDWRFPLGLLKSISTATGGSTLFFMVEPPILAVIFKCFRTLLPDTFQYYGAWGLVCYALQGGFACVLLNRYLKRMSLCVCLTPLFLLMPFMIWRMFYHMGLQAQFILLFTIFIWVFRDQVFYSTRRQLVAWATATALTPWIELYHLLPVGFAMVGFLLREWMEKRNKKVILIFFSCVILTIAGVWLLGAFEFPEMASAGEVGFFSMNLLSSFDSDGYSRILPDIPSSGGNYEGWQYLGISGILLLIVAVIITTYRVALSDNWENDLRVCVRKAIPIIFVYFAVWIVALSPVVYFGPHVILNYMWFRPFVVAMGPFRSSGRAFWLCSYAILLFSTVVVFRHIRNPRLSIVLAAFLVLLQAYDISPLISRQAYHTHLITTYEPVASEVWDEIAERTEHMDRLCFIRWGSTDNFFGEFFASDHHLTLNNASMGRNDKEMNRRAVQQEIESVVFGNLDRDTLYYLKDEFAFTDACLTGENVVELRTDGFRIYIHKDLWDQLDQIKYRDIYQESTGEFLTVRQQYLAGEINAVVLDG